MLPFPHEKNSPLKPYSTLGVGGPARYLARCESVEQMQEWLSYCHTKGVPFLVLGKGSNCLFDDRGFNGLVILNKIDRLEQREEVFVAGAGYSFARLGGVTARKGWSGLEFAAGIPASVGGAIYMNAGANGHEVQEVLTQVSFVDERGGLAHYSREKLAFGYRFSSFQKWKGAIVEGTFALSASGQAKQSQRELLDYRLKTQPYGDPSAGCAFRNPLACAAGKLIEESGLKGKRIGGAEVSDKHGNFIVNRGGATAADVRLLIREIKETVFRKKNLHLEEEIRYIPYED